MGSPALSPHTGSALPPSPLRRAFACFWVARMKSCISFVIYMFLGFFVFFFNKKR